MSGKTIVSVLQNVILPVVTVGTATMVAWLNYSVSRVDQGLKEQIAAVDIAIKEARDEREKINAEREFNFRIYDLVLNSLEEGNQQKQEVAKQFVLVMVDGELCKRLLGVLEEGGTEEGGTGQEEAQLVPGNAAPRETGATENSTRERRGNSGMESSSAAISAATPPTPPTLLTSRMAEEVEREFVLADDKSTDNGGRTLRVQNEWPQRVPRALP